MNTRVVITLKLFSEKISNENQTKLGLRAIDEGYGEETLHMK